jgi:hypothetical protein
LFFLLFLSFSFFDIWWRVVQSASHAQQFFLGGQMGVNEWANLWMNESSSRIYFQKYQCSFHRSL